MQLDLCSLEQWAYEIQMYHFKSDFQIANDFH